MKLLKKIEGHFRQKKYCRITTGIKNDFERLSYGYILQYNDSFILFQETDDFQIDGYVIIPVNTIKKIRFNKNDSYLFQIHKKEGITNKVQLPKYKIDISCWNSIFKNLKSNIDCIISECEAFEHEYFCIGGIKRVNKNSVSILYFNAQGYLDTNNIIHKFSEITRVTFNDRYSSVFKKYKRINK